MNHHTGQIDGPGMTVEIDKSKFGKLKFNRGRCIEGQWVFGVLSDMWKAYDCIKDEGYTHLTVNTWWGVKRSMPRTGLSKDLFESYLQEWLWRQHYGDEPFENIIKHIADLYEVRKDA